MLKSLKTTNFRKMEANHIEFESGMVVVRGANEAGKTTMLEAIAYALFGVKSCRGSLAEVVTWGKPEASLSVELVVGCDGTDYTIKRSKAGAEINYEGGKVTGQNECSAFVERLFGVTNGNAGKLIYGSQGDIRGALSQGPKATMELIENLANFDLLDTIIEMVQVNLVTGPTAAVEAVLQAADLRLQLSQAQLIEPEPAEWEALANKYDCDVEDLRLEIESLVEPLAESKQQYQTATAQVLAHGKLADEVTIHTETIRSRTESIQGFEAVIAARPDNEAFIAATKEYEAALNSSQLVTEYNMMTNVMASYPEDFWEGSEESLDAEITNLQSNAMDQKAATAVNRSDIKLYQSQKVTGSVCGFCDQDVSKFPEVLKKNEKLDADITLLTAGIVAGEVNTKDIEETLVVLRQIKASQFKFRQLVSDNVQAGTLQVPVSLSWVGKVPTAVSAEDLSAKRSAVQALKAAQEQATAAEAKLATTTEMIAELEMKIAIAKGNMNKLTLVSDINRITEIYNATFEEHAALINKEAEAALQVSNIREAIRREASNYAEALKGIDEAKLDVEIAKKSVDDLVFNNALVKRLRAARPIIADRLWNVVLGAVSSYFSAMRGFTSCVTKESDGFKVDGQSVEGLSGSTLDILGLSIRLALTRTFLPSAPFLILDEPSAAMDDNRSQEMVGFLLAFGFAQTLMVTHKEVNEGAANQLITI